MCTEVPIRTRSRRGGEPEGAHDPGARTPGRPEARRRIPADEHCWLQNRDDPAVIAWLEGENERTSAAMAHTEPLQETLFREIRNRILETDASVPCRDGGWFYYTRFEKGKDYPIHCRKRASSGGGERPRSPGDLSAPEEVLLDVNALAEGHDFLSVAAREVSPDGRFFAFAYDTVGDRVHTIRFRNLDTGDLLPDEIPAAAGDVAWAADGRTVLYSRPEPTTLRAHRVHRHTLGTDPAHDPLVYEEEDETFWLEVYLSRSRRILFIASRQTVSTEVRYLDAADPGEVPRVLLPRTRGHEYEADHLGEWFWLRTNDGAKNFRLVRAPVGDPRRERWEEVVPERADALLEGFELFRDHLVLEERADAVVRLRIHDLPDRGRGPFTAGGGHCLELDEPAYHAWIDENREPDTRVLRFGFSSLATPATIYDYDMESRERVFLKREAVLGGFDPDDYVTERVWATAEDGTRIPISLVRRADVRKEGVGPLLLYGYGAYGYSLDPSFSSARLSLLDRGFTFAIAHVRGGQELGRAWYEAGRLLRKKNTFTDFIACAEHLVREGYTEPGKLFAMGRSAGGLLMGAVLNLRPDLFHGVVAGVPFVDVVTTMLDETLPLTTGEYDEWGDPRRPEHYDYIRSYSPYDNVEAGEYPHLLVTTALHDSQVQFWEPAKWVARLRALKTDDRRLLLKTNLKAGHGGASGRYERFRELAFEYAFLLDVAGIGE